MEISDKCCIPFCKAYEDPSISLHEFPTSPDIAAKWIRNINLFLKNGGTWFPQSDSLLCSAHFLPSDFVPTSKKKTLKRKSAPSLFIWRDSKSNKPKSSSKSSVVKSPMIEVLKPKETPSVHAMFSPSNLATTPIQVSKVVSLSGINKSNSGQSSSSLINLPTCNSDLASKNVKSTPALFNGQQLLLLPQVPPGTLPQSTGFIIIPEGKPLPNLGKDLVLIPEGKGLPQGTHGTGNILLLQQQPNLPPVINNANVNAYKNIITQTKQTSKSILKATNDDKELSVPDVEKGIENDSSISKDANGYDTASEKSMSETQKNTEESPTVNDVNKKRKLCEYNKLKEISSKRKKYTPATKKQSSDLIEIAPSTFMKINPDIIRVAKKETPNGNTVLQFIMNPNLMALNNNQSFFSLTKGKPTSTSNSNLVEDTQDKSDADNDLSIQVDDSNNLNDHIPDSTSQNEDLLDTVSVNTSGPILASTHLSGTNHSFLSARMKYAKALKLKGTQIHKLTSKIKELEQKVEELENKCIVQERQLNFASLKKLKRIKKDADQGNPHAGFILEQIRGYANTNRVVWSDTTLIQCSIWWRKAPYAYDYFKKADLFRLPAMTTIKRFISRNPEIKLQIKNKAFKKPCDDSSSSSDFDSEFDFDETDNENVINADPQHEISMACENIQTITSEMIEDSQSSMPLNVECRIIDTDRHPTLSESSQSASDPPHLLVADSSQKIIGVKSVEHRQPLTNIFGKILCRNPKGVNLEGKLLCTENENKLQDTNTINHDTDIIQVNGNVTPLTENNSSCHRKIIMTNVFHREQDQENNFDDSTNQNLVLNNDDSAQVINNDDSNSQEITVHQTVLSTEESAIINDEDSNTFYIQTSEEDGMTTLKVDGQEIVIPPGTILKLNSDLVSTDEMGNHFLIIPNAEEESNMLDNEEIITGDVINESTNVEQNTDSNIAQNSEESNDISTEVVTE